MHRPNLLTRSRTAPQLPPTLNISPSNPSFTDPFSPRVPHHSSQNQSHRLQQIQTQCPDQNLPADEDLTHHFTQSTISLASPHPLSHTHHTNTPLQKHITWPLRRSSLATLATKSLPHLPLRHPTRLFHRLRNSFSNFLLAKRDEGGGGGGGGRHYQHYNQQHRNQNQKQRKRQERRERGSEEDEEEDVQEEEDDEEQWTVDWDESFLGQCEGDDEYWEGERRGRHIPGLCLHLPPEVSRDRSEIEYLRRLEREAVSARMAGRLVA